MNKPIVPEDLRNGHAAMRSLVRACIAIASAKFDRNVTPADYARREWEDHNVDLVLRSSVSPTALSNSPALSRVSVAFLQSLVPTSAGADLLQRGIGLNFGGASSISVPALSAPTPGATFVSEGSPIPVATATSSSGVTLAPYKLGVIVTLTSEMLVNPNVETLVRAALVESCGPALDAALLSNTAGTPGLRPPGLLYGIAPLSPAASGPSKGEVLVDDLQALATALGPVSGNGQVVLVASPDAAAALRMRLPQAAEWPVLTSASLAARTVIAVASNALVSAIEGPPQVDASTETTLVRDTQPQTVDDAMTTPMQYVGTMYQSDQVGLRLRWQISWALRTSAGLAYMQNVNW
jgi:hypothetical protein